MYKIVHAFHGCIQNIPSDRVLFGRGGGLVSVLYVCVFVVFVFCLQSISQRAQNASQVGYVLVFLKKPITTCAFPGGSGTIDTCTTPLSQIFFIDNLSVYESIGESRGGQGVQITLEKHKWL